MEVSRKYLGSFLSPFTTWVLDINPMSSGLVAGALIHGATLPILLFSFRQIGNLRIVSRSSSDLFLQAEEVPGISFSAF